MIEATVISINYDATIYAEKLLHNGIMPAALSRRGLPVVEGWQGGTPADVWQRWHGVGVVGVYGLVPIDIDTDDPEVQAAILAVLPPPMVMCKGRRGFKAFYFDPTASLENPTGSIRKGRSFKSKDIGMLCEVLVRKLAVIPPTPHRKTGQPYIWTTERTLYDTQVQELPVVTTDTIERLETALAPWRPPARERQPRSEEKPAPLAPKDRKRYRACAEAALRGSKHDKDNKGEAAELAAMAPNTGRNGKLFEAACKLGWAVHHGVMTAEEIEKALLGACRGNGLLDEDGEWQCLASIRNGFAYAEDDPLPDLPDRPPTSPQNVEITHSRAWAEHRTLDTYTPEATDVAWWPYLILGEINLIGGRGGEGKGVIAADMAARITQGAAWPFIDEAAPQGRVLWFEAEDGTTKTVLPRLIACGADTSLIEVHQPSDFPGWSAVREYIEEADVRLIVINPLIEFFKDLKDINSEKGVRNALAELRAAIQGRQCLGFGICHLNKKADLDALERLLGASAFANVARSVIFLHREPPKEEDEAEVRRIVHRKFNLSVKGPDLLFHIEHTEPERPRDQFLRPVWETAERNVDDATLYQRDRGRGPGERKGVGSWLYDYLDKHGPALRSEVMKWAEAAGHNKDTVQKAFQRGVKEGLLETVRTPKWQAESVWSITKG